MGLVEGVAVHVTGPCYVIISGQTSAGNGPHLPVAHIQPLKP